LLEIKDLSHLSPAEAHQKVAYVQFKIWYEQTIKTPFVKDPRPEYYLRNELAAFWEGRIKEFHGWTDPVGQVAEWVVEKVKDMLSWFWENVFKPGIETIIGAFRWIWDSIKSKVESAWDWILSVYNKLVDVYNYLTRTIYDYLRDAWSWLRDIGSTIYSKVREALNVVWEWVQEAASFIVEKTLESMKVYFGLYQTIIEAVRDFLAGLIEKLHSATESAWHSLTEFISGKLETITKALAALPQSIAAGFKSAVSYIYDILKAIWDKVIVPVGTRIKDALEWIAHKLHDIFITVLESLENIFRSVVPITPERAPNLALTALKVSGLAAAGLLAMAGVWDALHPFKDLIPGEIKAMIYDVTNFNKILGAFTGALFAVSIAQPMKYYYNATFRPYVPTWSDIMELRSRGKLDDETFVRFMHYYGYDDIYKPYFDELANTPAGYFMLRMMASTGFFDEKIFREEIARLGYAKETQEFLFETFKRMVTEPTRGIYSSYIINRYIVGITDLSELEQEAAMLGYFGAQIKQIRIGALLRDDYEYIKDVISALQYAYRRGYITLDEFRAQLGALGLRAEKIQQYVTIEQIRKKEEVGTTQEEEVRAYGRSTAIRRFREGLTTESQLEQELRMLGYSDQWIQRLKIVAMLERDYDFAMSVLSAVKSAWEKEKIGDEMFIQILRDFGFTDDKIMLELQLLKLKKGLLFEGGGEA